MSYPHTASLSIRHSKYAEELKKNAEALSTAGKGILAADESTGTIGKRLAGINVENVQENRRAYRELLFTAPEELNNYVSGVIMFEETFYETFEDGTSFAQHLANRGIIPGIKLDKGLEVIPGTDDEKITKGLDTLNARAAEFYAGGARFAKWRNVLRISANTPTQQAVDMNAEVLARYALLCQLNGLVPIVEPEILMDGDHDIVVAAEVARRVLAAVFKKLADHGVYLQGCLLKPNMVVPGADCPKKATPGDVGYYTVRTLQETVPPALPGVFFLSGGQSEEEATLNLNAINAVDLARPWHLSFSYGRALQHSVLKAWQGKKENVEAAQAVLIARAKANSEAQLGKYVSEGDATAQESLYQRNYSY